MLGHKDKLLIMMGAPKKKLDAPELDEHESDEDSSEDEGGDLHSEGLKAAAEDLIAAVHSKDAEAVAEALKNAFECASDYKDSKDEDKQEGEDEDSEYK